MRFKKGSKVEVMNKKEVPMSWSSAEIMYGNGHTYTVRYDVFPGSKTEAVVERVSRKTIRPCPPPVEGVESWVVGDIVEVFHDISWKIATVLKVYGVNYYLVRLFGISEEFRVHRTSVRVRQSWKDDTWVVMGKDSRCSGDVKSNELSNSNCNQKVNFEVPRANMKIKPQPGYDSFAVQHNTRLQESHIASSRSLKRASPYCSSLLEAQTGNYKKTRAIEKEGRRERAGHTPLPEKGPTWRHTSLAFKGLKMMLGLAASLLATMEMVSFFIRDYVFYSGHSSYRILPLSWVGMGLTLQDHW